MLRGAGHGNAGGLIALRVRFPDCLAIIVLAETHAATGSAEDKRKIFRWLPTRLVPGLVRSQQKHFRGALHSVEVAKAQLGGWQLGRQSDFRGDFDALPRNVEKGDSPKGT